MNDQITSTPQVYVACLAAYNEGTLHGKWVEATDEDEIWAAIKEVIDSSPATFPEEWAVHDYDGFGGIFTTEYPSVKELANVGALIEANGDKFIAFLEAIEGFDLEGVSQEDFDEHFRGEFDSERDYAMENVGELGLAGVPAVVEIEGGYGHNHKLEIFDELSGYINWDTVVRDLFQHGPYTSRPNPAGGIFVFEEVY